MSIQDAGFERGRLFVPSISSSRLTKGERASPRKLRARPLIEREDPMGKTKNMQSAPLTQDASKEGKRKLNTDERHFAEVTPVLERVLGQTRSPELAKAVVALLKYVPTFLKKSVAHTRTEHAAMEAARTGAPNADKLETAARRAGDAWNRAMDRLDRLARAITAATIDNPADALLKQEAFRAIRAPFQVRGFVFEEDLRLGWEAAIRDLEALKGPPEGSNRAAWDDAVAAYEAEEASPESSDEACDRAAEAHARMMLADAPDIASVIQKFDSCEDPAGTYFHGRGALDIIRGDLERLARGGVPLRLAIGPWAAGSASDDQFREWEIERARQLTSSSNERSEEKSEAAHNAASQLDILIRTTPPRDLGGIASKLRVLCCGVIGLAASGESAYDGVCLGQILAAVEGLAGSSHHGAVVVRSDPKTGRMLFLANSISSDADTHSDDQWATDPRDAMRFADIAQAAAQAHLLDKSFEGISAVIMDSVIKFAVFDPADWLARYRAVGGDITPHDWNGETWICERYARDPAGVGRALLHEIRTRPWKDKAVADEVVRAAESIAATAA